MLIKRSSYFVFCFQLKKQIYCLENGIPFDLYEVCSPKVTEDSQETTSEDMTEGPSEEDSKSNIELITQSFCKTENITVEGANYIENNINLSDSESQLDSEVIQDNTTYCIINHNSEFKSDGLILNDIDGTFTESSDLNYNSFPEYRFSVDNIVSEIDPMKNLRMSIRRKRVCSGSSALSNSELVAVVENKEPFKSGKKTKRKCNFFFLYYYYYNYFIGNFSK